MPRHRVGLSRCDRSADRSHCSAIVEAEKSPSTESSANCPDCAARELAYRCLIQTRQVLTGKLLSSQHRSIWSCD
jgi:hypothetical protein